MASNNITLRLLADARGVRTGVDQANKSLTSLESTAAKAGNALKGALGGFLAFQAIGSFIMGAANQAASLNSVITRTGTVFNDSAGQVKSWAKDSVNALGLSERAALESASGFGNMFTQLGFAETAAADMATTTVELAADLGAFNDVPTAQTAEMISAALRGEYDSLQRLIPNINAARVEQEAMAASGKKNASELTAQEKVSATLAIITRDGAKAQGAFASEADSLSNKQQKLTARWEDAQATLGQLLVGPMTSVTGFLTESMIPAFVAIGSAVGDVVGFFNELPGPVQTAVVAFAAIALLKGPVGSAFETMALRAMYARTAIAGAATSMAGVRSAGRGIIGMFGGPWGLAIGGAVTGLSLLVSWLGNSNDASEEAKSAQREFADALRESNGVVDESVRAAAAKAAQDSGLLDLADSMGLSLSTVTDAVLGNSKAYDEVTAAADAYLQERMQLVGGNTEDAHFQNALAATQDFTSGLDELAPTVAETAATEEQLASATEQTGGAMVTAAEEVRDFSAEASEAKKQVDAFKLSLDVLTGAHVTMIEAESSFQSALASANGALKEMTGSVLTASGGLDLQSESGRKAADVLLDVRNSGNTLIATMKQQGASADEVAAAEARLRTSFLQAAGAMGIEEGAANALADQILGIPSERTTQVNAITEQASSKVATLQNLINGLQDKTVVINAVTSGAQSVGNRLKGFGFASGGFTGWGRKHDLAGFVHRGEFVFPQEAVNRLGVSFLGRLAGLPGYAAGGFVGPVAGRSRGVGNNVYVTVQAPVGSSPEDIGRGIQKYLDAHKKANGR